jgi:hypothetical protein
MIVSHAVKRKGRWFYKYDKNPMAFYREKWRRITELPTGWNVRWSDRPIQPPGGKASTRVDRTCVHCGCTDSRACPGGCAWAIKHKATPTGVCSNCSPSPGGEGRGEGGHFIIGTFIIVRTPKGFWIQSAAGEGLQTTEAKLAAAIRNFFNREF